MKCIIDVPDFDKYNMPSPTKGRVVAIPITIGDETFNIPTEMAFIKPYTEPDHKAIEDEVWEFARRIVGLPVRDGMSLKEIEECFGTRAIDVVLKTPYQEVKAKYDDWKAKREQIHVGDEVEQITDSGNVTGLKCIVTYIDGNEKMRGIGQNGNSVVCSSQVNRWWRKTGRHFNEIEELLKKMKENK